MEDLKETLSRRVGTEVAVEENEVHKLQQESYDGIVVRKENESMYFISLSSLFVVAKFDANMAIESAGLRENGLLWNMIYLLLFGIKTGVSEEILCRGFIGRKLIDKLGFEKGNMIQAFAFAIFHIINLSQLGMLRTMHRIINAFFVGLVFGYVMEKDAKQSIIPGIVAHASYNILSSTILLLA